MTSLSRDRFEQLKFAAYTILTMATAAKKGWMSTEQAKEIADRHSQDCNFIAEDYFSAKKITHAEKALAEDVRGAMNFFQLI